jgi:hypothetical protein
MRWAIMAELDILRLASVLGYQRGVEYAASVLESPTELKLGEWKAKMMIWLLRLVLL